MSDKETDKDCPAEGWKNRKTANLYSWILRQRRLMSQFVKMTGQVRREVPKETDEGQARMKLSVLVRQRIDYLASSGLLPPGLRVVPLRAEARREEIDTDQLRQLLNQDPGEEVDYDGIAGYWILNHDKAVGLKYIHDHINSIEDLEYLIENWDDIQKSIKELE